MEERLTIYTWKKSNTNLLFIAFKYSIQRIKIMTIFALLVINKLLYLIINGSRNTIFNDIQEVRILTLIGNASITEKKKETSTRKRKLTHTYTRTLTSKFCDLSFFGANFGALSRPFYFNARSLKLRPSRNEAAAFSRPAALSNAAAGWQLGDFVAGLGRPPAELVVLGGGRRRRAHVGRAVQHPRRDQSLFQLQQLSHEVQIGRDDGAGALHQLVRLDHRQPFILHHVGDDYGRRARNARLTMD